MIKIAVVVIVFAVIIVFLRSVNPEISTVALIAAGCVVLLLAVEYVGETFGVLTKIVELTGVDSEIFNVVFKITAVGYIVEFAAGTVEDLGVPSLAHKLVFIGKLTILTMSLPILYAIFNLLSSLLQ